MAVRRFDDRAALIATLGDHLQQTLQARLDAAERATIALSGGSTPAALYRALRDAPLDWARVDVTLSDERCVPPEHPDANAGLLARTLFAGAAGAARWVPLMGREIDPAAAAAAAGAEARLAGMDWPLDLLLLGMGEDRHTASLFPGAPQLAEALDPRRTRRCLQIDPPGSPYPRLSLALPALLDAREIHLLITGMGKWRAFEAARDCTDPMQSPVSAILGQDAVPVTVWWAP